MISAQRGCRCPGRESDYQPDLRRLRNSCDFGFAFCHHHSIARQRNVAIAQGDEAFHDSLCHIAVARWQAEDKRPFFLYLAYNAVHSPLQGDDGEMVEPVFLNFPHPGKECSTLPELAASKQSRLRSLFPPIHRHIHSLPHREFSPPTL
jgi:hypothetical protein